MTHIYRIQLGQSVGIEEVPTEDGCCKFGFYYVGGYNLPDPPDPSYCAYAYSTTHSMGFGGLTSEKGKVMQKDLIIKDKNKQSHRVRIIGGNVNELILNYIGIRN